MKLAITADNQFAEQGKLSHQTDAGITSRLADQIACFRWIVDTAVAEGCERLVAIGDLYDSRKSIPVTVLDQVCRVFDYASKRMKVDAVVGNHDTPLRTPNINSLQTLLGSTTVWDAPGVDGVFAFVPWIEDPDDYRHAIGTVAKEKGAKYLFSHVMIEGAVPADVGKPKKDLRPQRWDRIFLGDIHEPMEFSPNIQYAGAPMQHHYGDVAGERGFFILDTKTDELVFYENEFSPRFHLFTEDNADSVDLVEEGDFVRIRVTDPDVGEAIAAEAGKVTSWVENEAVRLDDAPPRLDVSTAEPHEVLMRRYVENSESPLPDLVAVGTEIMEELE